MRLILFLCFAKILINGVFTAKYILLCINVFLFFKPRCDSEKKGLMFMETSALGSTNVEAAFSEVLTGKGAQKEHSHPHLDLCLC